MEAKMMGHLLAVGQIWETVAGTLAEVIELDDYYYPKLRHADGTVCRHHNCTGSRWLPQSENPLHDLKNPKPFDSKYIDPKIATEKAKVEPIREEGMTIQEIARKQIEKIVAVTPYEDLRNKEIARLTEHQDEVLAILRSIGTVSRQEATTFTDVLIEELTNLKRELTPRKSGWRPKVEGVEPVIGRFV